MHLIGRRCLTTRTAMVFSGSYRILSSRWPGCATLSAKSTTHGPPGRILLCTEDLPSGVSSVFDYAGTLSRSRPTPQPLPGTHPSASPLLAYFVIWFPGLCISPDINHPPQAFCSCLGLPTHSTFTAQAPECLYFALGVTLPSPC
jgi:hypothetical protein